MSVETTHIGFVGLGALGASLAASLRRAGYRLTVTDLDRDKAAPLLAQGAAWADDPAALARDVDAAFTCLPSFAASQAVLTALLEGLRPGAAWVETSTLGPDEIRALAAQAEARGVRAMEAPVTGGVHLAARGEVAVLAGGDPALFERFRPAFEAMGNRVLHMGPLGSAATIKVITNMLAFVHLVACGEGLMLAKRGGVDLAQAWRAIAASSGSSFVHETEGQLILNGSYDVAFSMDLAMKDLGYAMQFGRDFGVPMALAETVAEIFRQGREAYGGAAQSTQIVKLLEDALGTDLRAPGFPDRLE